LRRGEPFGVESSRVLPKFLVAVENPWDDQHR
jgi:hypothetical protein